MSTGTPKKKKTLYSVPDEYELINPVVPIEDYNCITLTDGGICKINNTLSCDSSKRSYSQTQIFFSKEKNRYLVKTSYRSVYTLEELNNSLLDFRGMNSPIEMFQMFDLNPDDFNILSVSKIEGKNGKRSFYTQRTYYRTFDCVDYICIGYLRWLINP